MSIENVEVKGLCITIARVSDDAFQVTDITGPEPLRGWCMDLIGDIFNDIDGLNATVAVRERSKGQLDGLDRLLFTPRVGELWQETVDEVIAKLAAEGVFIHTECPDEKVQIEADGTCTLYCDWAGQRISLSIPAEHWSWKSGMKKSH